MRVSVVLLVAVVVVACGDDPVTTTTVSSSSTAVATTPIRILALGDSYTIGEGVPAGDRWPVQLARALETAGWADGSLDVVARTGWTTDELGAGIDAADPEGPFDLVTLLIGVNDQYRGRTVDAYRVGFVALLERAIAFAGDRPDRVIVVSIPDWGATPFGAAADPVRIAGEIDAFNAVNRDEAAARGVPWVDVTAISRGDGSDLVAADGLHPSASQYAAWIEVILPVAIAALDG